MKKISVAAVVLLAASGCAQQDTGSAPTSGSSSSTAAPSSSASSSMTPSSSASPSAKKQTPVQSVSPSQSQKQVPDDSATSAPAVPVWKVGDEQKALDLAVKVISLYGAGTAKEQWIEDLKPYLTPEAMSPAAQVVNPVPLKMNVTGKAVMEKNTKTAYTAWITVPTDKGPWSVQVRRDATVHPDWLANVVVPTQARGQQ